jgi:hypothetical protein
MKRHFKKAVAVQELAKHCCGCGKETSAVGSCYQKTGEDTAG